MHYVDQICVKHADMANFLCIAEPTLTVDNVVGVMSEVTSGEEKCRVVWGDLLPWRYATLAHYLDEVYTLCKSDEGTHTLADVYINSSPESSWQHLHQTLYREGEMAAAKKASSFLQQNG